MAVSMRTLSAMAGVALAVAGGPAQAAPVTFSGIDGNGDGLTPLATTPNADAARDALFANLSGVGTETFETRTGSAPLTIGFGSAGNATLTGPGSVTTVASGQTDGFGRYSVPSPTTTRFWDTAAGSGGFVLTFSAPIAAFGFYGIDIGDVGGTVRLRLTDTANGTTNLDVPLAAPGDADGSVLYFGFYDLTTQYNSIAFVTAAGQDVDLFAFDNFSIGAVSQIIVPGPVPEPMSLALFGLGMAGLALVRRAR